MASRNPDFAALSEAAYEAADNLIAHMDMCRECGDTNHMACDDGRPLGEEYRTKKAKALQAIRGKKK